MKLKVAETSGPVRRIVGVIRGTVKKVATGKSGSPGASASASVGYILGLRVVTSHRYVQRCFILWWVDRSSVLAS
jgi:hypothetical protein